MRWGNLNNSKDKSHVVSDLIFNYLLFISISSLVLIMTVSAFHKDLEMKLEYFGIYFISMSLFYIVVTSSEFKRHKPKLKYITGKRYNKK